MSNLPTKICPSCTRNPIEERALGMCDECFNHEVHGGNVVAALVVIAVVLVVLGSAVVFVMAR